MDKILDCLKVYIFGPLVYVITLALLFPSAIITTIFVEITNFTLVPFITLVIPIAAVFLFLYRCLADDKNLTSPAVWKDEKRFLLTEQCELVLLKGDITKWHVDGLTDAIVIHPYPSERSEDPLDEDFHAAARTEFLRMHANCVIFPGGKFETRRARTPSLPVAGIIETEGQDEDKTTLLKNVYKKSSRPGRRAGLQTHNDNEDKTMLLKNIYKNSCATAIRAGLQYVAFPPMSRGENRYSPEEAARIAVESVLMGCDPDSLKEVHIVFGPEELRYYDSWLSQASSLELNTIMWAET